MPKAATKLLLERNALFKGLPDSTLGRIETIAVRKTVPKGTVIFLQGDEADALYMVVGGKIRVSTSSDNADEVFLNLLEAGDSFGEIALLDGQPRTADAVAVEETDLVLILREHFLPLLKEEHELTMHLLKLCCERVRWTSEIIEDSVFLLAPARLAKRLLSLARLNGAEIRINQADLASFLNISRPVVNQHLQSWVRANLIEVGRGRIRVLDENGLQRVVSENLPG